MAIGLLFQVLVGDLDILLFNMPSPEAFVLSRSVGDVPCFLCSFVHLWDRLCSLVLVYDQILGKIRSTSSSALAPRPG